MPYEEESIVREWLDHLKDLKVEVRKMFGCWCLYCDGQAVGWIHDSWLKDTGRIKALFEDNLLLWQRA